jgi:hypothetical protein
MALDKQLVTIPLGKGIDTKTDPKLVSNNMLELENAVFTSTGQLKKRFGMDSLGNYDLNGNKITSAKALTVFQNELGLITNQNLMAYSGSSDGWISKAEVTGVALTSLSLVRNTNTQSIPDVCSYNGLTVYAYEDSAGGVRTTVVDQNTGLILISNYQLNATAITPKCSYMGNYILVWYVIPGSTTLACRRISIGNPTAFEAEVSCTADIHASGVYDICKFGVANIIAYRQVSANIKIAVLKNNGQFAHSLDGQPGPVTFTADATCIAINAHYTNDLANDAVYVTYYNSVNNTNVLIYNTNLINTPSPIFIDNNVALPTRNITSINNKASQITICYEKTGANAWENYIAKLLLNRDGTISGSITTMLRGVGLVSKLFIGYDQGTYAVAAHQSQYQSTSFLVRCDLATPVVVNRISYQNCGGLTAKASSLCGVWNVSTYNWVFANVIKTKLNSDAGILFANNGISRVIFSFDTSNLFNTAQLGLNLHIGAGMLLIYDGVNLVEAGFNLYPENITTTTAGGSVDAGTHQWKVIYEWTDAQGQIHRSAPSIPPSSPSAGTTNLTLGGASAVTIKAPILRLTSKPNCVLSFFRTRAGRTIFYKVGSTANVATLQCDPTGNYTTFTDNNSDDSILGNELLYTTGGVLENIAPPSCTIPYVYNNRLVLVGLENPNDIWFSREFANNEAVNFSDLITTRIDQGRVGITAEAQMDEKIVFFKDNSISIMVANGPTNTGFNNDIGIPQSLATDVGCISHKSVVVTPNGLMFKSKKGYYQLDRALQLSYIGDAVEKYNNLTCSGAVLIDETNQVRFTNSDGDALVYDYYVGQWGIFTNYKCVSSRRWNRGYVISRANGIIDQENSSEYIDNNSAISLRVVTPWIKTAGIQGFQRIYEALLVGQFRSSHTLRVRIGYDYNDAWKEDYTISTATALNDNVFGKDSPFGNQAIFGGSRSPLYQFKINNAQQKCQAIRYEISDINRLATDSAGMNLTALTLVVGIKKGAYKVPKIKNI